jgi:ATPase subunit of ABC transporter with duplicated ATPase domains
MSAMVEAEKEGEGPLHIDVKDLTFSYPGREPVSRNLNMQLTNGARCLLIGAKLAFQRLFQTNADQKDFVLKRKTK